MKIEEMKPKMIVLDSWYGRGIVQKVFKNRARVAMEDGEIWTYDREHAKQFLSKYKPKKGTV